MSDRCEEWLQRGGRCKNPAKFEVNLKSRPGAPLKVCGQHIRWYLRPPADADVRELKPQ